MARGMRGGETYRIKLKYGVWIDIRYCSHSLFRKKKETLTLSRCLPPEIKQGPGSHLKSDPYRNALDKALGA